MRAILLALLLVTTPMAAASRFVVLDATPEGPPTLCGARVCVPIHPDERSVRLAPGSAYEFLADDGALLGDGLGTGLVVDVPAGAAMLVVSPP